MDATASTPISSRSSTLLPGFGEGCFKVSQDGLTPGWTLCVHPQGWIYYFNPALKVVTDQDLRQQDRMERTEYNCSQYPLSHLSEGMEVHLHMQTHMGFSGTNTTFNLVINHAYCVASYDIEEIKEDNICYLSPSRLNRCRRQYWNYLWNHPVHVPTPGRALEDTTDALTWFYTDNLISGARSTVPFSKSECEELSRVVRDFTLQSNEKSVSRTVFLAWFLREVCSFRDAESYGMYTQKELLAFRQRRLNPQNISQQPSPFVLASLNFIINALFFGIPHTYRAHVKITSEYRGRLASVQQNWEKYIERLVREYSHFLLIVSYRVFTSTS
ncbi:hypothetical protein B0H34DRAFT_688250 [Crassisporium funariophilum]|nr:hypothetical protein B0H34DRAFT_688250 [Crassisporium funariophilum]